MSGNNQNPMTDFSRVVGILVNPLIEAGQRIEKWYEQNEPQIRRFLEVGAQIMDGLPNWISLYAVTFARGGWSEAPLGEMNLSESMALLERLRDEPDDEVVRRELDRVIPEYFRRNGHAKLRELVERWDDEHFEKRQLAFDEALWAHTQGRYTLSIHALAPQIEGVLRDVTGMYERRDSWMDRFNNTFDFTYDRRRPVIPDWSGELSDFWALPLNERYEHLEAFRARFALLCINELYVNGKFFDPEFTSKTAKRHPIAHGVFTAYGETESLRLFCVLDLLHDAVSEYKRLEAARLVPEANSGEKAGND